MLYTVMSSSQICSASYYYASVGIENFRIDFDVDPSTLNKEEMNQKIKEIVSEDHPIFINQISGDNMKSINICLKVQQ